MKRAIFVLVGCVLVFFVWRQQSARRVPSDGIASHERSESSSGVRESVVSPPLPRAPDWSVVVSSANATGAAPKGKEHHKAIRSATSTNSSVKKIGQAIGTPKAGAKEALRDPLARAALSMVGVDSEAESYWAAAINDPSLSEKEREDLIEDLNEVGFEDPKNPTLEELPLIVNRLELIEEYAPFAMDDVNARSFAEAYKDLSNMYQRLTRE